MLESKLPLTQGQSFFVACRDLDKDEVDCDWEGSTSHSRTREEKCEEQLWNKIVRGVFAGKWNILTTALGTCV